MKIRNDIQILRGIAVGLVVINHAKFDFFKAGYLGVDIFFVISGYLITKLIADQINGERFSFIEFYLRRAKRLLPAALTTFVLAAAIAPFILTPENLKSFSSQLVGSLTFTANIVLWRQADYFNAAASLKPLLHTWSLSLEEQYYLFIPIFLTWASKRYQVRLLSALCIVSFVCCVLLVQYKPSAAFYLLPTRIWELGIGSLLALAKIPNIKNQRIYIALVSISWFALLFIPSIPTSEVHPGIDAALVVIATAFIIYANRNPSENIANNTIVKLGNISYSLYLVHWPIFAFMNNVYSSQPKTTEKLLGIAVSLGLAFALHKYVETPGKRIETRYKKASLLAFTLTPAVIALIIYLLINNNMRQPSEFLEKAVGLSERCDDLQNGEFSIECKSATVPQILIWGDSFAMHLVPGLKELGITQATRVMCGPFVNLAPVRPSTIHNEEWAQSCIKFNDAVLKSAIQQTSLKYVVISSPIDQYLPVVEKRNIPAQQLLEYKDGQYSIRTSSSSVLLESASHTISLLQTAGKKVIFVAPPPSNGIDYAQCNERAINNLPTKGFSKNCTFLLADYKSYQKDVLSFLDDLEKKTSIKVIRFDDILCNDVSCNTQLGNKFIYRDSGHLSNEGSIELANRKKIAQSIFE